MSTFTKKSFFNGICLLLVLVLLAAASGICSHNDSCHSLDMETSVLQLTVPSTAHSDTKAHHDESKHILDCHCIFHGGIVAVTLLNTSTLYLNQTSFYCEASLLPHLLMTRKIDKPPCFSA